MYFQNTDQVRPELLGLVSFGSTPTKCENTVHFGELPIAFYKYDKLKSNNTSLPLPFTASKLEKSCVNNNKGRKLWLTNK